MTMTLELELTTRTQTSGADAPRAETWEWTFPARGSERWTQPAGEADARPADTWPFVWRMGDGLAS